jgi:hypothetical protein
MHYKKCKERASGTRFDQVTLGEEAFESAEPAANVSG